MFLQCLCGKIFLSEQERRDHINKMHGGKIERIECLCKKVCYSKLEFMNHLDTKHPLPTANQGIRYIKVMAGNYNVK